MTLVGSRPIVKPGLPAVAPRRRPVQGANATLVARERLGADMARFRFRPDDGPERFVAGQYAAITMVDPSASRPYSMASRPGAPDLDFVISRIGGGALTPRLFALRDGDRVHIGRPRGRFRLDDGDQRDHLLIGTGSGIAPLLSMVAALGSRPAPPRTFVFHGARVREELAGQDTLTLADGGWLSYRPTLSRIPASDAWVGGRGHVGAQLAALIACGELAANRTVAYLCGGSAMVDDCRRRLAAFGLPPGAIRSEGFSTT